jgi:hypothetical protein
VDEIHEPVGGVERELHRASVTNIRSYLKAGACVAPAARPSTPRPS